MFENTGLRAEPEIVSMEETMFENTASVPSVLTGLWRRICDPDCAITIINGISRPIAWEMVSI